MTPLQLQLIGDYPQHEDSQSLTISAADPPYTYKLTTVLSCNSGIWLSGSFWEPLIFTIPTTSSSNTPSIMPKYMPPSMTACNLLQISINANFAVKNPIFSLLSNELLNTFKSASALPVLHILPENDADQLLRLHLFFNTISAIGKYISNNEPNVPATAVVVVDSLDQNHEGFKQACWVIAEHTQLDPLKVLNGAGFVYGNFAIIKGTTLKNRENVIPIVQRVLEAINVMSSQSRDEGFIWHESANGYLLSQLLQVVATKPQSGRNSSFKAISTTSGLSLNNHKMHIKPGLQDKSTRSDILKYIKQLNIPLLLVDKCILSLHDPFKTRGKWTDWNRGEWTDRANSLPGFSTNWNRLLPINTASPIIARCMDELATEVYRARATSEGVYGDRAVTEIKKELDYELRKPWACGVLNSQEYTEKKCKGQSMEKALVTIGTHVEAPIDFALDAFIGTLVDRQADTSTFSALRVDIKWNTAEPEIRLNSQGDCPVYILYSTNRQEAHTTLLYRWNNFVEQRYYTLPIARMQNRFMAKAWKDLMRVLVIHMGALVRTPGRNWSAWELQMADRVLYHVSSGSMTSMCAKN